MYSKVPLGSTETPQCIASEVPLSQGIAIRVSWGRCERCTIECLASGVLGSIKIQRLLGNYIGPDLCIAAIQLAEGRVINIDRRGRAGLNEALERPTTKKCVCE